MEKCSHHCVVRGLWCDIYCFPRDPSVAKGSSHGSCSLDEKSKCLGRCLVRHLYLGCDVCFHILRMLHSALSETTLTSMQLPIWFQAVKNTSATESGIDNLPSLISLVIFAIIGGVVVSYIGYYTPMLLISSVLVSIGAGLLSTLQVDSKIGPWFGYQVLFSAGVGLGAQNALLVASVAVAPADLAMATSILTFTQTLSSAIFLPIAQSVFQNQLSANLISNAPEVDTILIIQSGATGFRDHLTASQLPLVLNAYNKALCQTFYVGVGVAALSIFGPIFMEWLSLKPKIEVKAEDGGNLEEHAGEVFQSDSEVRVKRNGDQEDGM